MKKGKVSKSTGFTKTTGVAMVLTEKMDKMRKNGYTFERTPNGIIVHSPTSSPPVDNTKRDNLLRAICEYTGDGIAKVLPWVKKHLEAVGNTTESPADIKKGDRFVDDDEDIFTVTKVTSKKIHLKDEDGVTTTFPDDFDDDDFDVWFTKENI